jgi:hypothetical protein
LKGEERVCHVTEADRLGAAKAVRPFGEATLRLSGGAAQGNASEPIREVSSCEAAVCYGPLPPAVAGTSFAGAASRSRGSRVLPLCAAVGAAEPLGSSPMGLSPWGFRR